MDVKLEIGNNTFFGFRYNVLLAFQITVSFPESAESIDASAAVWCLLPFRPEGGTEK